MAATKRVYSREFKLMVVRQAATGEKRAAQVCREHNLASSVYDRWRQEYAERGETAFSPRELVGEQAKDRRIAELEQFCGHLAMENHVLKKALHRSRSQNDML